MNTRVATKLLEQTSPADGFIGDVVAFMTLAGKEVKVAEARIYRGTPPLVRMQVPQQMTASEVAALSGLLSEFSASVAKVADGVESSPAIINPAFNNQHLAHAHAFCLEVMLNYSTKASEGKLNSIKRNRNNWKANAASECADLIYALDQGEQHKPVKSARQMLQDALRWRFGVENGFPRRGRQIHPTIEAPYWYCGDLTDQSPRFGTAELAVDAAMEARTGGAG